MFENFVRKVKENNWPVFGIEVFYNGHVTEKYDFVPEERHPVYSATKAFTSTAVGIAADEGKFSLEASVYDYLKDEVPAAASEGQISVLKKISMKRLLTMLV
jgi:CubicO group peptidase (beta-lactamase class C family)